MYLMFSSSACLISSHPLALSLAVDSACEGWPFTEDELGTCMKVFESLYHNPELFLKSDRLRATGPEQDILCDGMRWDGGNPAIFVHTQIARYFELSYLWFFFLYLQHALTHIIMWQYRV